MKNILSTVEKQGVQLLADEKLRTVLLAAQHAGNKKSKIKSFKKIKEKNQKE